MANNTQGSQSKIVVLVSTIFMAALCIFCLYLLYRGPDPGSVFFFHRSAVIFYPVSAFCALFFGYMTYFGFRRLKTM
ncbi:MAG: hypothetical protein FWF41_06650 [Betaproteobacteria bacterium]|nr:hypothetical protein [Betaproteobacteria bacterium]